MATKAIATSMVGILAAGTLGLAAIPAQAKSSGGNCGLPAVDGLLAGKVTYKKVNVKQAVAGKMVRVPYYKITKVGYGGLMTRKSTVSGLTSSVPVGAIVAPRSQVLITFSYVLHVKKGDDRPGLCASTVTLY